MVFQSRPFQFMPDQWSQTVSCGAICTNAKEQDTFPILPPHDLRDHLAEHAGTQRGIFLLTGIEIINVLLSDLFFHNVIPPAPFCYCYYRQTGQLLFAA